MRKSQNERVKKKKKKNGQQRNRINLENLTNIIYNGSFILEHWH